MNTSVERFISYSEFEEERKNYREKEIKVLASHEFKLIPNHFL